MQHPLSRRLNLGEVRVQPTGTIGLHPARARSHQRRKKCARSSARHARRLPRRPIHLRRPVDRLRSSCTKAWIAIALVVLCIILFIAFAFRKVSKPGAVVEVRLVAIITLVHDILIPVGLFALLGHFRAPKSTRSLSSRSSPSSAFLSTTPSSSSTASAKICASTTSKNRKEDFDETVGRSIMQTLARSINTSLTVVIVLLALYFLGPGVHAGFRAHAHRRHDSGHLLLDIPRLAAFGLDRKNAEGTIARYGGVEKSSLQQQDPDGRLRLHRSGYTAAHFQTPQDTSRAAFHHRGRQARFRGRK